MIKKAVGWLIAAFLIVGAIQWAKTDPDSLQGAAADSARGIGETIAGALALAGRLFS